MTEIIDRRCTATEADNPEADADRLRRRADVRARAAKLQFQKDRIPVLEAVLAESHARVEAASDAHSAVCTPLQSELTTLEAEAVERIQRREPADATADRRRGEIIREIAMANAELEAVVEAEKTFRAPTEKEIWELRNKVLDPSAVLSGLAQPPLVSPRLLVERHVRNRKSAFLKAREESARKALKIDRYNVQEITKGRMFGDIAACRHKVACWEAEVEAAGRELAEALAEGERIHKAMIDE